MLYIYVFSTDAKFRDELREFIACEPGMILVGETACMIPALLTMSRLSGSGAMIIDHPLTEDEMTALSKLLLVTHKIIFTRSATASASGPSSVVTVISKPLQYAELSKALNANNSLANPVELPFEDYFYVKSDKGKFMKVSVDDIFAIEAHQNYITIVMSDARHITNFSLSKIETLLPNDVFIRVHRSFIVNKMKIHFIESKDIYLIDGMKIPVGQSYRKQVLKIFDHKLLDAKRTTSVQ